MSENVTDQEVQDVNDVADRRPRVLTPEERRARDAARKADAAQAMQEHEATQKAFRSNFERLKAERLAREAKAGR